MRQGKAVPRVAAIHDLSGFGRCALTVVIPVMSAMGVQVCPLPTAILSTHTGGFSGFFFRDLTADMRDYIRHWDSLNIGFDCIYSGFLGSEAQIGIVSDFIERFGAGALVAVDPVMGDEGQLYKTYTPGMCQGMRSLVRKAHIITPNLTEAAILLEQAYPSDGLGEKEICDWLVRLSRLGPQRVVITGIRCGEGIFNYGFDAASGEFLRSRSELVPVQYPGTGDLYASVLIAGLLNGDGLPSSMGRATWFVGRAAAAAHLAGAPAREGVPLEPLLGLLLRGGRRFDSERI